MDARDAGDVAETCRTFGISRKTFYEWRNRAGRYGLEALVPKGRRAPQLRRELERTRRERDILAKAVAFFSESPRISE